ncbi:MAG: histidine phosphatase family protein [Thermoplasmatales archaeon]
MGRNFTLAIARHGQTESNVRNLWVGRGNDSLTPIGREQSRQLAISLKEFGFDFIVTSDMLRAVQTAEIVSEVLKIPIIEKTGIIRDRDYGILEGMTTEQILEKYGIRMGSLSRDVERISNAEPVSSVIDRVNNFLSIFSERFEGKKVIVITHGAFVRAFYELFVGSSDGIKFTNCSNYIVNFSNAGVRLVRDITFVGNQ